MQLDLDDRRLRWLLWVALGVLGLGLWFFVLRGADQPDDPTFEDPSTTAASAVVDGGALAPEPTATTVSPGAPDVTAAAPGREPFGGFEEVSIAVDPGDGEDLLSWCLLLARTLEQRGRGMVGISDLQGYEGMAFLYPEDIQNPYHMRNVPRALSIAWFTAGGEVVSTADMAPCPAADETCPLYTATGPYRFSIEVFQGRLDDLGIGDDSTVWFTGPCG